MDFRSGIPRGRSSPGFEFTLAHLTIYALYLAAFVAFEWFLRALAPQPRPWYWTILAYTVFLWATLDLVGLHLVTPDIAVVRLTFAAAALARESADNLSARHSGSPSAFSWALRILQRAPCCNAGRMITKLWRNKVSELATKRSSSSYNA